MGFAGKPCPKTMDHIEIANRTGVSLADLESLLTGRATAIVAHRLNVSMMDIEDFIKGSASQSMASCLGLATMSAAEELARAAGPKGAAGLIIGLLISN